MLISGAAHSHSMGPGEQIVWSFESKRYVEMDFQMFNYRKDIEKFQIQVFDFETRERLEFGSVHRIFFLKQNEKIKLKIFMEKEVAENRSVLVCTKSMTLENEIQSSITTVICGKVETKNYESISNILSVDP